MKIIIESPFYLNEIGQRKNNEDNIYPLPGKAATSDQLFLVCDGVGGSDKGEVASKLVCEFTAQYIHEKQGVPPTQIFFNKLLQFLEKKLSEHVEQNPNCRGMKTTLTLLWLRDNGAYIAWVGDSRVYQFRNGRIVNRTEDHSLVNEMVKRGELTREEAQFHRHSNVILRAIAGENEPSKIDSIFIDDIEAEDIFLLCTDGINEKLTDTNLIELSSLGDLEMMHEQISAFCNDFSNDNYSMYLIGIEAVLDEEELAAIEKEVPPSPSLDQIDEAVQKNDNRRSLFKYVLMGLALIAVVIGGLSMLDFKKKEKTKELVSKAVEWEQLGQLDSAMLALQIARKDDPNNPMLKESLTRVKMEIRKGNRLDSLKVDFEANLERLKNEISFLSRDTTLTDSLKMLQINQKRMEKVIRSGLHEYALGNNKQAYEMLKFRETDSTAIPFLKVEGLTILRNLYKANYPNDSIYIEKQNYCNYLIDSLSQ